MQSRARPPHKDLPNLQDVLDEGKGLKKTKAKDTPLQPPTLCRFRDVDCQAKQLKNGGQIGMNPATADKPQQVASNPPKSEGNWFQRVGRKITGAFAGASLSAANNSPKSGHSFLPPVTAPAVVAPPTFTNLNDAKLDPHNRIGTGGEDLFSGNYHWSTPLVSLPGRGGLDLNLSLHYNSLQWVKYGSTMFYDPDWYAQLPAGLTTGFNFGFPEIESGYIYDGVIAYVVTMPSGYRVPLRRVYQLSSTVKYEAVDGSYLYLVVQGSNPPILYTPDGTQYTYGATSGLTGGKRCSQVRDSNGNRINITYNSSYITSITDTLGRVLNFSYTGNHLMQITQTWQGQTHVWAQFDYGTLTLNYNFPGFTINGPANNSQLSVLTRVITNDGARHVFVYNSWGLVDDIFLYGAADNQRAYLDYAFPNSSVALSDGPRFTQRNDGIFGWAGQVYNPTSGIGYVANYFAFDANEAWGQVTTPDGVVHKELFSTSGITRGLSTGIETWVSGVKRKWATTSWDSSGTTKPMYPRVTETNTYDDADGNGTADNRRRATVAYTTFTKTQAQSTMPYTVYLPSQSTEYAADAATIYRYSQTDYVDFSEYWNRWMGGVSSTQRLYDGANVLQAQSMTNYDEYQPISHPLTIAQHDTANYGGGMYWRGNATSARRYSVVSGTAGSYTETQSEYFVTGNPAKARDALSHETKIFYDDTFATYADDASNTETVYNPATKTYAYPTQVQSPAPEFYSSYVKYWYDTGAATRTTDPKGAVAFSLYELTHGRLAKAKNAVNGAYTRYVYGTDHNYVQTLSTINSVTEETAVLSLLDGASRERQRVDEHPGSVGTLSSSYRVYDLMGRVVQWSNPTEICASCPAPNTWNPTGDDTAWAYSTQTYDWNHRPWVTTNQDLTQRTITYTGCGCPGGMITTLTDEVGRQQKAYADFLGRTFKTETWQQIQGTWSVYSTNQTTFNVRDQVTQNSLIAGTSGTSQNITMQYDGYGRLWKRKSPLETADMVYSYNNDDTIQQVKDARLAATNYAYNTRGLVTDITYAVPPSNPAPTDPLYVAPVQPVHFTYDSAGNRETMTDGIGLISYAYDTLSRMQSETRTITELNKSYSLTYDYNLVGQVKQVNFASSSFPSDNASTYYNFDKTGKLSGITGSPFAGVTQYTSQVSYRAFGEVKALTYGSNRTLTVGYDARTRLQNLRLTRPDGYSDMNKEFHYYADSKIKYAEDITNRPFDRAFKYDHSGRLEEEWTGWEARTWVNQFPPEGDKTPLRMTYQYNVWGNLTTQTGKVWGKNSNESATYQNQRRDDWLYDNAGNVVSDGELNPTVSQYDTAGRNVSVKQGNKTSTQSYDGDGLTVRRDPQTAELMFYVRSSVLQGKVMAEIKGVEPTASLPKPRGSKLRGYVYSGQMRVATQISNENSVVPQQLTWDTVDPVTGTIVTLGGEGPSLREPNPRGVVVPNEDPTITPPATDERFPKYAGVALNGVGKYVYLDQMELDEADVMWMLSVGAATVDQTSSALIRGYFFKDERETRPGSGIWEPFDNFEVTGLGFTAMTATTQEARINPIKVTPTSLDRVYNIAMTALAQVPGCRDAFVSTTIGAPTLFLNYLRVNNRIQLDSLDADTLGETPGIGKNAVIKLDKQVMAGKKGIEDITRNGQLSFEAGLTFL